MSGSYNVIGMEPLSSNGDSPSGAGYPPTQGDGGEDGQQQQQPAAYVAVNRRWLYLVATVATLAFVVAVFVGVGLIVSSVTLGVVKENTKKLDSAMTSMSDQMGALQSANANANANGNGNGNSNGKVNDTTNSGNKAILDALNALSASTALQLAIIKNATDPAQQCAMASLDRLSVYRDAIVDWEAGYWFPADPIIAVGDDTDGGRIVVMVNKGTAILHKHTHERISFTSDQVLFNTFGGGDPYVVWDDHAHRFIMLVFDIRSCWSALNVLTPSAVAGAPCSAANAAFGPNNYAIGATEIVLASPLNACSTVSSAVAGKIALVVRGTCFFHEKVANAQAAGAIGVVIYNNVPDQPPFSMGGFNPSVVIPAIMIGNADGLALAAHLPATATLMSGTQRTASTYIDIAVSTSAAPNDASDFLVYRINNAVYNQTFADYPKMSVDADAVYIMTNDFGEVGDDPDDLDITGCDLLALDKAALIDSTGVVELWQTVIPKQMSIFPAIQRVPLASAQQPMYFVGVKDEAYITQNATFSSALHVYMGYAHWGFNPTPILVPFPTPMTFDPWPERNHPSITARQPSGVHGLELLDAFVMTAVVWQERLYTAVGHVINNNTQAVVRWFEMDISRAVSHNEITLVDWGDVNPGAQYDVFMPHVDVDRDGNLAIGFSMTGPTQPVVAAYTGRLRTDPPHTVRYPVQVGLENEYPSFFGSPRNRWGDYHGIQLDPVDRKTFRAFNMVPDPLGWFMDVGNFGPCDTKQHACVANDWTTGMFTFQINSGVTCAPRVPTYAATKAQPTSGSSSTIASTRAPLNLASLAGNPNRTCLINDEGECEIAIAA